MSLENTITYVFSHFYTNIEVESYGYLPIEKKIDLDQVIILIKSVLNKNQNNYCYNLFLEKWIWQLAEK